MDCAFKTAMIHMKPGYGSKPMAYILPIWKDRYPEAHEVFKENVVLVSTFSYPRWSRCGFGADHTTRPNAPKTSPSLSGVASPTHPVFVKSSPAMKAEAREGEI